MKFVDDVFFRDEQYALGLEQEAGEHYVSFPVSAQVFGYEEFYRVSDEHYAVLLADPVAALAFVIECRRHEHDDLLMIKPGPNRGTAI